MYCTSCGTRNTDESNFCQNCGHRLRPPRAAASVDDLPPPAAVDEAKVTRLLDRAFELYDSGSVDQAFEVCRTALRLNPDSATAHFLLSTIYEKQGNLEAAVRQMELVVDKNPGSSVDVNRLESLRRALEAAERGEPEPAPEEPVVAGPPAWTNPKVVAAIAGALVILLAMVLISGDRANRSVGPASINQAAAGTGASNSPDASVAGGVFDGLGSGGSAPLNQQAAPRDSDLSPRTEAPARRVTSPEPARAAPARAVPAAAPPRPASPAPSSPATPRPSAPQNPPAVRITREPANSSADTASDSSASAAVSAKEYQKRAMDFKQSGDRSQAIEYFRRAISAYKAEAAKSGGGFQAQQGIRTCQVELRLLGASD